MYREIAKNTKYLEYNLYSIQKTIQSALQGQKKQINENIKINNITEE